MFDCTQRKASRILPQCVPQWRGERSRAGPLNLAGGSRVDAVEASFRDSASTGCSGDEEGGLRLFEVGARPEVRGIFGETALHWAALLGEDRLVAKLIDGSDLNLKDEKYRSPPLGWAVHGWCNPPAGNHGRQH